MDAGIWSSWYDLPADGTSDFLDWAHREYLPWLKQLPGIAWVAHYRSTGGGPAMQKLMATAPHAEEPMPQGGDYILLVGAPAVHAFWNPFVLDLPMPDGFKAMLARRKEVRDEFYTEESRVDGASGAPRSNGKTPAPAIQFGTYRMRNIEAELYLGQFNTESRFPAMAQQPGCIRVRKLANVAGWPKHGVLYEFESLESRLKNHEEPLEAQTLLPGTPTGRNTSNAIYAPGSPFIGERLWPPIE
jgi:hypothetical protein